jgi:hypothetical protein
MKKLTCPKCGMEASGGRGFWGTSKPYCSFCGWNLQLAKEVERASIKQSSWGLLFLASFFAFIGYLFKSGFALFPFLFLSVFIVGGAIESWRKLRLLEAAHPAPVDQNALTSVMAPKGSPNWDRTNAHQYLWALTKPRRVRLKPVARVITIAFPISWIFIVYFGFQIARDEIAVSRSLATLRDLSPLLLFALIWSVIGTMTIRSSRRHRKLLAKGDLAMAVVTHQETTRGRHRQSKIRYEFQDTSGRVVQGTGTDESWRLYEDMEAPVFYNPTNPSENVALCAATCELGID